MRQYEKMYDGLKIVDTSEFDGRDYSAKALSTDQGLSGRRAVDQQIGQVLFAMDELAWAYQNAQNRGLAVKAEEIKNIRDDLRAHVASISENNPTAFPSSKSARTVCSLCR